MKVKIHPPYYETQVTCACGNRFTIGSTREAIRVELCSICHPFYTGQQKFIDTVGRIERFKEKQEKAKIHVAKKTSEAKKQQEYRPRTLKEMLMEIK